MRKLSSFRTIATLTVFHRFKSPVYSSTKESLFSCLCPFLTTFMNGNSYGCIKTNNKLYLWTITTLAVSISTLTSLLSTLYFGFLWISTYSCIKTSTDCKAFEDNCSISVFEACFLSYLRKESAQSLVST